ncbi:hypothetical protein CPB84DRAFT_1785395 [Gymnopilus junonius]|uniref:Uncharacterized protein n=1 Tax=Gymnopilus junonius TaxID=109634 RepID=A0A9P5NJ14_GYMJU|nr:hypothetical protein CPB84DRAFT_1785395 [Gymnopilus junonius]
MAAKWLLIICIVNKLLNELRNNFSARILDTQLLALENNQDRCKEILEEGRKIFRPKLLSIC